jgi:glyoxylase-like metal-dependent hydrolase (beta-lactamase superfamily II)
VDVIAVDVDYVRAGLAASHLLIDSERAAFVDTGTAHSVPRLLAALAGQGLGPAQVDYVLLTHIHLDHAGGAGQLMQHLPHARCVVHPRGARHMVAPAKLVAGSKAVYGDEVFDRLYGELLPIQAQRIIEVADGQRLTFGSRTLEFIHTPGHALHHCCIVDAAAAIVFTGDTFGLSYRELDVVARGGMQSGDGQAVRPFIFPTTTPVHFDPQAAHASIERILSYAPRSVYLTHFGRVDAPEKLAPDLHADLDVFVAIARRWSKAPQRAEHMRREMFEHLSRRLDSHGHPSDAQQRHLLLDMDVELNVQGLEVWADKMLA